MTSSLGATHPYHSFDVRVQPMERDPRSIACGQNIVFPYSESARVAAEKICQETGGYIHFADQHIVISFEGREWDMPRVVERAVFRLRGIMTGANPSSMPPAVPLPTHPTSPLDLRVQPMKRVQYMRLPFDPTHVQVVLFPKNNDMHVIMAIAKICKENHSYLADSDSGRYFKAVFEGSKRDVCRAVESVACQLRYLMTIATPAPVAPAPVAPAPVAPVPMAGAGAGAGSDIAEDTRTLQISQADVMAMLCQSKYPCEPVFRPHIHRTVSPSGCECGMCTPDWLDWAESVVPTGSSGDLRHNPELVSTLRKLGPRIRFAKRIKQECSKLLYAYVMYGPFRTKEKGPEGAACLDQSGRSWILCLCFIAWTRLRLTSVDDAKRFADALVELSGIFDTLFLAYMRYWEIAHMPEFHKYYFEQYWGNGMGLIRLFSSRTEMYLPPPITDRIYRMLPNVGCCVWRDLLPRTDLQWFEEEIFEKYHTFMLNQPDHSVVFKNMSLVKCLAIVHSEFAVRHKALADFLSKWLLDVHLPMATGSDTYVRDDMLKLAQYDPSRYYMFKRNVMTRRDCFSCSRRESAARILISAEDWDRYIDQYCIWDFLLSKWEARGTTLRTLFDAAYGHYRVNQLLAPFDGYNVSDEVQIENTLDDITVLPRCVAPSEIMGTFIRGPHDTPFGGPFHSRIAVRMWLALLMHDRHTIAHLLLVSKCQPDTFLLLHAAVTQFYTDLRAEAVERDPSVAALDEITFDSDLTPRMSVTRAFTVAAIDQHMARLARPLQIKNAHLCVIHRR